MQIKNLRIANLPAESEVGSNSEPTIEVNSDSECVNFRKQTKAEATSCCEQDASEVRYRRERLVDFNGSFGFAENVACVWGSTSQTNRQISGDQILTE